MTLIVTGASGQFGRAVAELLLDRVPAEEVILTTRTPETLADLAGRGARVRVADFDDPASLATAFAGGDRMLLISTARVGSRVGQHENAVNAAKAVGVSHIIYTSILGAADPGNPAIVKLDHRATEEIVEASGIGWNFLRDSQYAEAVGVAMAPIAIARGRHFTSSGDGRVGFVSRLDCVDCAVALLTGAGEPNRVYVPTGGETFSHADALALVSEISGKPIEIVHVTSDEMLKIFDDMGVPRTASDTPTNSPIPWVSEDMISFDLAVKRGIFDVVTGDVQLLTGHRPISLREILISMGIGQ